MANENNPGLPVDITADTKFVESIVKRVTVSGRLPFSIPPDHIPIIISDAAKLFYKKHYGAFQIKRKVLRYADLVRTDGVSTYCLPDYVIAVTDLQEIGGRYSLGLASARINSLIMLNAYGFTEFLNGTISSNNLVGNGQSGYHYQYDNTSSDSVLSIYEASFTNSFFTKYVSFGYNDNSHQLTITGGFSGDLAIEYAEGIEMRYLYNDELFIKYVHGQCLVQLNMILNAFDFKMPGNVEVNYKYLSEIGQAMVDKVLEDMEDQTPGDIFAMG